MKFLGLAAHFSRRDRLRQLFTIGKKSDYVALEKYLTHRYSGQRTILTKNGRSALTLALQSYFEPGDKIIVNGFTCYAVYEAVKAAGLEPVFADIDKTTLNFNSLPNADGIIVQNSLGNTIDIKPIENSGLIIIEDLAHCAGRHYPDGREVGTVGAATAFSFGKDKSIDTVSGGAVVLRKNPKNYVKNPSKHPKLSDHLRARFYPTFGAMTRALAHIHLGGPLMRALVKIHFVEKSADSKLSLERKPSKFQAKLALAQFKNLRGNSKNLREFYLVNNRDEVLQKLKRAGYHFAGFWYEKPVSPERYYKKVHFPEKSCPNATFVAAHIINFPNYYTDDELKPAYEIIKPYLVEESK
ncbi:DegT/DnrJ/EryC1/StrS family aminotransferase [Candidatus Saccharibacteria bacterium]|nr:DegT/DnrJ/EryC1/StrS family aminotransferase [Candidatus Saccharibacteria bacterium]